MKLIGQISELVNGEYVDVTKDTSDDTDIFVFDGLSHIRFGKMGDWREELRATLMS